MVASEVKNLATQTGDATKEIAAQIEQIQDTTRGAVAAIEEIAATITEDELRRSPPKSMR